MEKRKGDKHALEKLALDESLASPIEHSKLKVSKYVKIN